MEVQGRYRAARKSTPGKGEKEEEREEEGRTVPLPAGPVGSDG